MIAHEREFLKAHKQIEQLIENVRAPVRTDSESTRWNG